jgi:BlaI family transcriptional regulator, penicillinase repressor
MRITAAEGLIMDVLWRAEAPMAAEEVRARLDEAEWSEATVRTLLTRLVKKKAVAATKDRRRFLYRPLVQRAEYAHAESRNLLDRLFDGRIGPFVAQFSERQDLTDEEVAELKSLIERLGRGR